MGCQQVMIRYFGLFINQTSNLRFVPFVGIDDFAWRKGHRYGVLICDGLTHQPVDVLPDREKETLENWFKEHTMIIKVTRDRYTRFKEVLDGISSITQIHDRFHLIQNLWTLHDNVLRKLLPNRIEKDKQENVPTPQEIPLTKSERARIENANKKWEQACHMKELKKEGYSLRKIGDILNIDPRTVKKYIEMTEPPSLKRTKRPNPLDAFQQEVIQWETDGLTIRAMYHNLKEKNYTGTYGALKYYVASIRKKKKAGQKLQADSYYDRKNVRKILWQNDLEDEKKRKIMNEILTKYPKLRPFYAFITSFRQALKDRDMPEFRELILYEKDRQDPLTTHFISRLLSDFPPTLNAIELDENNGFLEGQVNRLKTIKRMLYGRASFPLLRLRILYQP